MGSFHDDYDDDEYDEEGIINLGWLLTFFFAAGIWAIVRRYQKARDRGIPFSLQAPPAALDPHFESMTLTNPNLESHLSNPDLLPPTLTQGRKYITCYDPATSLFLGTCIADEKVTIDEKIEKAARAQRSWRRTDMNDRRRVARSLQKWLVENSEICSKVVCRDTGKTMVDAALGEILTTCCKLDWLISHGEEALRPERRHTSWQMFYKYAEVHYEPRGVVAAIVSWNYPLHNAWSPILAAIFAGNGIVVKCSEHVIWSTSWFVAVIRECLTVCGFDPDIVQLVCSYPEASEALTTSPLIKHITFIGSEEVGRKVAMAATLNLTPVTLELGGKDPAIILPGTDINKWLSVWMRGIFTNAGQNCIGIERLIVHSSLHDELLDALTDRVQRLRLGSVLHAIDGYISPVDGGSMISKDRFPELERLIAEAVYDGATIRSGGSRWKHAYLEEGVYFSPTVLGDVLPTMEIAQKEVFAPIALLMRYETIEEAVQLANGTRYGLGASVFGPDERLCKSIARQLECGMVSVNDFGVTYMNQDLPFGGTKASGYGRFGGPEGLRSLTNPKAIVVDRFPSLMQTSIPAAIDYPVGSLVRSWEFMHGLIQLMYADAWKDTIAGVAKLLRTSYR